MIYNVQFRSFEPNMIAKLNCNIYTHANVQQQQPQSADAVVGIFFSNKHFQNDEFELRPLK